MGTLEIKENPSRIKGKIQIFKLKNGKWIKEFEKDNLVVNTGITLKFSRLIGNTKDPVSHIAVGTGSTAVIISDNTLETELARQVFDGTPVIVSNTLEMETTYGVGQGVGTWREAGVFNDPTTGDMLNRVNINFVKLSTDIALVKFILTLVNV